MKKAMMMGGKNKGAGKKIAGFGAQLGKRKGTLKMEGPHAKGMAHK